MNHIKLRGGSYVVDDRFLFSDYALKRVSVGQIIKVLEGLKRILNEIDFDNPSPPASREEINALRSLSVKQDESDSISNRLINNKFLIPILFCNWEKHGIA
jgi:hypothetical protein